MKEEELKETKTKDRRYKTYQNLLMYLKRKKLDNCGSLATFLLETFINSPLEKRDGEFVLIFKHDLELAGLISEGDKFEDWRDIMIKRGVLTWKVRPNDYNFVSNKNYFAPSESLLNYINKEKLLRSTVATMDDVNRLDNKIENKADIERVSKLEENVSVLEEKVNMLEGNMNSMATIILKVLPPDTKRRRKIIEKYGNNPQECMKQLALDVEKNIKETGRMFSN